MQFLMNELSIHGQFRSAAQFFESVEVIMEMRNAIRRGGRELFCSRYLTHAQVTADSSMQQAIQRLPREKRQAWMQWLSRTGPFWSDERAHTEDHWLETRGERLVTSTAVGEAAFCCLHGLDRELVSFNPSDWLDQTVNVTWLRDDEASLSVDVRNHWSLSTVTTRIESLPSPVNSWHTLEEHARRVCERLRFASDAFAPCDGHPYAHGAAEGILIRLRILNALCGCFDETGRRTAEGSRLFREHFTGEKAWFSDSSDTEKQQFKSELTFPHPERPGEYLFCTWHGKVKTPQFRIHHSWPIAANTPLYVVYVGPKITKR